MKEKLSPFIKKINNNLYSVKDSYLMIDYKPLVHYLSEFIYNRGKFLNNLLEIKPKILIISNYPSVFHEFENLQSEILFSFVKFEDLNEILKKINTNPEIIIINFSEDESISFDKIKPLIKKECILFVNENFIDSFLSQK